MRHFTPRRLFALALLALALTGCGGDGGSGHRGSRSGRAASALTARLIPDEPTALFDPRELYRYTPATSPLAEWQQRGGGEEGRLVLSRTFDRSAATASALRVLLVHEREVTLVLEWAGAGQEFDSERRIELAGKPLHHAQARRYLFRLTDHPLWRGEIGRLRLQLATRPGAALEVEALQLFREQLASRRRLATVLDQTWKVGLGNDLRSAIVTVPGLAIERTAAVPERGRLRFACGLADGRGEPVTFRVRAGEDGEVVYERTLAPRAPDAAVWRAADVDLGRFAGREVRLVFETSAGAPPDAVVGFPAWANPELYGAADGLPATNVVLISIDTLRADRTSLYGNPRPTTPFLERWAAVRAAVFEQAVAQAPWTLPSHTSMLTGLNAFRHGVNHRSPAPASLELLAERLRVAGYSTLAITGGGYVHPDFGLAQGFDRFRSWGRGISPKGTEIKRHATLAREWIEEHADRPFFLFFHTYEVHHRNKARQPFFEEWSRFPPLKLQLTRPEPAAADGFQRRNGLVIEEAGDGGLQQKQLPPELARLPYDYYDSGIAFTDSVIGRLLDRLTELGLDERTLVIFTSDHGELLGEHGVGGHAYLYEENLLIPLVLAHPDGKGAGRRIAQQVRSIDIVPTVLDVLGLPPADGIDGASLVQLLDARVGETAVRFPDEAWSYAAASNYGVSLRVANRVKYHFLNSVWPPLNGREQLFDLRRDPGEQHTLTPEEPQLDALRDRLRAAVAPVQSGPRIALVNRGAAPFAVRLTGTGVRHENVKSLDLACPCLSWVSKRVVHAAVPVGTAYTLSLEEIRSGDQLTLFDDRDQEIVTYDLPALDGARRLALAGGRWREAALGEEVEREVRVWWHGARELGSEAPEEKNPELRTQLKALGYL